MYPSDDSSGSAEGFDPKTWLAGVVAWETMLDRLRDDTTDPKPAEKVASLRRARREAEKAAAAKPNPASAA